MTRNPSSPPMDLDLDAFLDSHTTSDDDDDNDGNHHLNLHSSRYRTVDEILLNDSDSDSSPSSSSPTSPSSFARSHLRRTDALLVSSPKSIPTEETSLNSPESLELSQLLVDDGPTDSKSSSNNPIKSKSGDSFALGKTALRPLPPLFGGVRANAKPGAALAAAAAASRSIPSPHLAAIKLRRASTGTLRKILDTDELDSKGSTSSEIVYECGTGSITSPSEVKLVEEDVKWDNFQTALVEVRGDSSSQADEFCSCEEMVVEGADESKVDEIEHDNLGDVKPEVTSLINTDKGHISDDQRETSFPHDSSNKHVDENHDLGYTLNTTTESVGDELVLLPGSGIGRQVKDLALAGKESHDSENLKLQEKDEEFGLAGEDTSSQTDVTENVEDLVLQWETKRGGKKTGKKSPSSMKPLELAEELEKKHAFTGLNWEEGAAAQPMRLEGVRRGSTVLGYFDISTDNTITRTLSSQAFRRDHGSPQVVAVHLNFIAVGMSRGVIIVFPSKYSPHHTDNIDGKMLMLGLQGDRSYSPVTSMCFNQQGDLLFAGYHDGHFTVWDVQRVSAVKSISEHKAPLVHMLYLGQDSQVTRQFNVVSGDSNGLVKLFRFSVFSWLSRLSTSRTSTLLDESRRTVLCASSLLSDEPFGGPPISSQGSATVSTSSIGSMMGGVVGGEWKSSEGSSAEEGVVILVTHQSALVAKVICATPEVYAQLPKPEGVREGSIPYTAWKFIGRSLGSLAENVPVKESENAPLLALAWDRKVQVAKLVKSEKSEKLELKIYGNWTLESSAIGVAWLDDQMLVILTSAGQLYLFAKDGTLIHQTSFAVDGPQGDDLIGYHAHFTNTYGNPEKAYHNFVAVRGATVYILGPTHLIVSRLLPWKERIQVLRKAGDWMGALNMAMTLYDGQAHGVIDLPRTLDDVQKAIMPYLVELLLSYVDEVFSYMSVAFFNQIGKLEQLDDSKSESSVVHMEIKQQFTRVGGVAVEFCVHIKRIDILFDEILSRFVSVQHRETFLELLEPYILKDMLGSLPPEIMQVLVEHYSTKGWLQRVEQCVLHMDISSLDFNQVVRLCREHRLYGALIYLFNKGLNDFRAPLEELLAVLRNSESETAAALGYRMLVYLKYCFSGLAFPPGHGTLPPERLPSLRMELIQFLLEDCNAPPSSLAVATKTYKNLYHLLELDTEATLDVLRCALVEKELSQLDYFLPESTNLIQEPMNESDSVAESKNLTQKIVDVLALILETARSSFPNDALSKALWPSKDEIGCLIEFIAYYVTCEKAEVSKELLRKILEYFTSEVDLLSSVSRQKTDSLRRREKMVLALLEVVPETDWDDAHLLHLCEKAQFYQVCGLIHGIRHQYLAAMESYMKDVDEPIHTFSFIYDTLQLANDSDSFQEAVISRIPDLVQLNREGTFFLVADRFSQESQQILAELHSHPHSLFLYLKTVTEAHSTGTLEFSSLTKGVTLDIPGRRRVRNQSDRVQTFFERISLFPKSMPDNPVHVTDEMTELYLELLCRYERNSVLPFLKTCESYRVEHCLRVCQDHGIIDATAFLWERVGDVGSALLLTLSDLNDRFIVLDATVQSLLEDAGEEHFDTVSKKEVKDILDIVHACVGLCQRNSSRLDPDESESLWFQLLDSFCEPLIDSHSGNVVSEVGTRKGIITESLGRQEEREVGKAKWKVRKSHRGAHIFRKLFSIFIKEIVEGMIGYVRLPTIMLKLLSDNGSQEFGDFRVTILGMLGTYDFERRILDTAKSLIEDDTYYTMSLLKKGASHGYGPRSLECCICNCHFTKDSSASSIRVFSCGHATHLHCELQEKDTSHTGYSAGCPICMPKKKSHKSKGKSTLAENGLVSNRHSKGKLSQGIAALHPHESDALDGSRQISRFEILNSLQKEKRMIQVENMPQLRLAPPAVYHEKVKKGVDMLRGESSSSSSKIEKTNKSRQIRDVKVKGSSSIRFPLKTNIFGKEKTNKR